MRGNHAPQGLLTLGWLTLIFTNSHVIIPSFGCVCVLVISGMRNVGKKFTNTFRRVTGSSSSRSSLHRSSTPTPSFTHDDEQAESQAPEEQVEHQEEEAPDDSHIELRGEREFQAYNMLKDRTFGHTRVFDEDLLEKIGICFVLEGFKHCFGFSPQMHYRRCATNSRLSQREFLAVHLWVKHVFAAPLQ